jgi:beta-N-acetylhexosaminidase
VSRASTSAISAPAGRPVWRTALTIDPTLEQSAGQMFLLSFVGKEEAPAELLDLLGSGRMGGVVLFRHKNMGTIQELNHLTRALQSAARKAGQPRLIIAADQEGGQLMAFGEGTPFPGNMALGATRSENLAYKVGRALGKELSAVGINVDFAPVCDVNNNALNPVIGTRSFGEDPKLVAALSAAMIRGLQRSGVAATAKHFPGHGDTAEDTHRTAPLVRHRARRLESLELVPFRAAIRGGVRLVMSAHVIVPALNGGFDHVPATLSPHLLRGWLREKLRFRGVIVSDALDMRALDQDEGHIAELLAAAAAGNDLLLFNHELSRVGPAFANLVQAARRTLLSSEHIRASGRRVLALKAWLAGQKQFPRDVIRCKAHVELARQVALRSITLVRDRTEQLPLSLPAAARIAVVVPRPQDLTPADTSSYVHPVLAAALRRHHPGVDEFPLPLAPTQAELKELIEGVSRHELVIVGTIDARTYSGQAEFVNALLRSGKRIIAVSLRLPYDLAAYPQAATYICTYSILPPAIEALADMLFGHAPFQGRLPVTIPGDRRRDAG